MTYEQMFTLSLFFWSFVYGLMFKSSPSRIIVTIMPSKAPPPEVFEKDYE